jgi:trans-aconitate methyltransferase
MWADVLLYVRGTSGMQWVTVHARVFRNRMQRAAGAGLAKQILANTAVHSHDTPDAMANTITSALLKHTCRSTTDQVVIPSMSAAGAAT